MAQKAGVANIVNQSTGQMGVSGGDGLAKMTDVLAELNEDGASGAKLNIHTDEVEEKDVAI